MATPDLDNVPPRNDALALVNQFEIHPLVAETLVPVAQEATTKLATVQRQLLALQDESRSRCEQKIRETVAFTRAAADETGLCASCPRPLVGKRGPYCSAQCADKGATAMQAKLAALIAEAHAKEEHLEDERLAVIRRVETEERDQLVALGRDRLRQELASWRSHHLGIAWELEQLDEILKKVQVRVEKLSAHVAALEASGATGPDLQNARAQCSRAQAQLAEIEPPDEFAPHHTLTPIQKRRRELEQAHTRSEQEECKLRRAWRALREQERDRRMAAWVAEHGGWPSVSCMLCGVELDDIEGLYCSARCARLAEAEEDANLWHGARESERLCRYCHRRFAGTVSKVPVFPSYPPTDLTTIPQHVCSGPCWQALVVDEDEPPDFAGAAYVSKAKPDNATGVVDSRNGNLGRVTDTSETILNLLLAEPDGLTTKEIADRIARPISTVQSAVERLRRKAQILGGGRRGKWLPR